MDSMVTSPTQAAPPTSRRWSRRVAAVLVVIVAVIALGALLLATPIRPREVTVTSSALAHPALLRGSAGLDQWLETSGVVEIARERLRSAGRSWETWGPRTVQRLELLPAQGGIRVHHREPVLASTHMCDLELVVLARAILHLYEERVDDPDFTAEWPALIDRRFWQETIGVGDLEADYWRPEVEALLRRLEAHPDAATRAAMARYRKLGGRRFLTDPE